MGDIENTTAFWLLGNLGYQRVSINTGKGSLSGQEGGIGCKSIAKCMTHPSSYTKHPSKARDL